MRTLTTHQPNITPETLRAIALLEQARHVFLTTHERTDGDDLGTVLALSHALEARGIHTTVGILGGVPTSLMFMPGSERVQETAPTPDVDLIVVSGCSVLNRTGLPTTTFGAPIINIDHHPDNELYGGVNIVDAKSSSVAEITYNFIKTAHWPITHNIAVCLLTGMMTDTGSFLHSNTQASTLYAASQLMSKGARSATVAKHTMRGKNVAALRAWGKALTNTWFDPKKSMVCSIITAEDLKELGNPPQSVFEGVVETINKVPEARFALFLKQDGNIVKGSLRSDPQKPLGGLDVGSLARLLGGGGHRNAAGFSVPGKLKRATNNQWFIENKTI